MSPPSRAMALAVVAASIAAAIGWLTWRGLVGPVSPGAPPAAVPDPRAAAAAGVAPAPQRGTPAPTRVIPDVLPDFSLATIEGPPRTLSSFRQPSLVVNFWATWCAPCRREIPLLKEIRRERGAKGVEVVGIAVDFRDDVLRYARQIGIDYPLLIGEQDGLAAANAFGLDLALPFTVFSDRDRRIVAVKIGELHANEADFILNRVAEINAGTVAIEDARRSVADALRRFAAERTGLASDAAKGI